MADDDIDHLTSLERKQLRQLLMRVGDDERQERVETLAKIAPDIVSLVEGRKATSAVLKFTEKMAKWIVGVAAAAGVVKAWFWGGGHAP